MTDDTLLKTATLHERLADERVASSMRNNTSCIGSNLDYMQRRLRELDSDISLLSSGIADRKSQIGLLQGQKRQVERRIKQKKEWVERFERHIRPLEEKYDDMVSNLRQQQVDLVDKYRESLDLLMEQFDFFPAYKRPQDEDSEWFGGREKPKSTFSSKNDHKVAFEKAFSVRKRQKEYGKNNK
ncbi:hypothetical protein P9112_009128 [Eukaryota sp. TZLM1-RC]